MQSLDKDGQKNPCGKQLGQSWMMCVLDQLSVRAYACMGPKRLSFGITTLQTLIKYIKFMILINALALAKWNPI